MRRFLFIVGSRADSCPLASVISLLGKHAIRLKTSGLYGHETALLSGIKYHNPSAICLLGDRYETLVSASVAALLGIPIIHFHGGDYTPNCVDEGFRNAISKLAYWHFPACELHKKRLVDMEEPEARIFVCGAPGVDALAKPVMSKQECESRLNIELKSPVQLVLYHPETLGNDDENLASIVNSFDTRGTIIISGANADIGGDKVNDFMQKTAGMVKNCIFQRNYDPKLWLSLMHHADMLIGNSSGFIFEGITLGKKFVHVGKRQSGRYEDALRMFQHQKYPFGVPGEVSKKIADTLLSLEIPERPIKYATAA